jgi:hypothetical protein
MTAQQILNWVQGWGWLVLSGGPDSLSDIRAQAITRISAEGGVAYIGLHDDDDEDLLEDMNELGAPTGFLVNILREDDETIREHLKEAALIVIPGDMDLVALHSALMGAAEESLRAAFERGVVILAEGPAATLFGKVFAKDADHTGDGFHWLEDALVVPAVTSLAESQLARDVLAVHAAQVAIGIGVGSALVLGPEGQIETWGQRQVTIALGSTDQS